jgi:hypothetical protein
VRADQYDRIKALSEKLTDVVLKEGDTITAVVPKADTGKSGAHYHNEERRLHWRKKNTMATLGILMRLHSLVNIIESKAVKDEPPPSDGEVDRRADDLIESAEREVESILEGLRKGRGR